jgi:hypothetical protein
MFGGTEMKTQKARRQSGYSTPYATVSNKALIENDLFINPEYNDWDDYRDGFRDWFSDFKKIKKVDKGRRKIYGKSYEKRIRMNKKQKRLLEVRKARKLEKNK